jgi:hypothetical protein
LPELDGVATFEEVVDATRRLDERSDRIVRAVLDPGVGGPVTETIIVVLIPVDAAPATIDAAVAARTAVSDLRGAVATADVGAPGLVRGWNTVVELADAARDTSSEQYRWRYARQRIRSFAATGVDRGEVV